MGQTGPVIFFAAVTASGRTIPTGTVGFISDRGRLGRDRLDTAGHAVLTAPILSKGVHQVVAKYPGTNRLKASTSPMLTQRVSPNGLCPAKPGNSGGRERQEEGRTNLPRKHDGSRPAHDGSRPAHDGSRPVKIARTRPERTDAGGPAVTIRRDPRVVARHNAGHESRPTAEHASRQRAEHAKNHSYHWL
ncbi:hypothetical protein GCM10023075_40820 [Streptosporangium album]